VIGPGEEGKFPKSDRKINAKTLFRKMDRLTVAVMYIIFSCGDYGAAESERGKHLGSYGIYSGRIPPQLTLPTSNASLGVA
jgi:hypothetical protein